MSDWAELTPGNDRSEIFISQEESAGREAAFERLKCKISHCWETAGEVTAEQSYIQPFSTNTVEQGGIFLEEICCQILLFFTTYISNIAQGTREEQYYIFICTYYN